MTAGKRAVTADTVASWMSCVDQAQADGLVHIPEPIAGFLDFCSGASPAHALARSGTSLARRDARWPEGAPGLALPTLSPVCPQFFSPWGPRMLVEPPARQTVRRRAADLRRIWNRCIGQDTPKGMILPDHCRADDLKDTSLSSLLAIPGLFRYTAEALGGDGR